MSDPKKQAFPRAGGMPYDEGPLRLSSAGCEGMTIREYGIFEMSKGILSNPNTNLSDPKFGQIANMARKMTDAAIKEMAQ